MGSAAEALAMRRFVLTSELSGRFGYAAEARSFGLLAGLTARRADELALVVAELASNVARHAITGEITLATRSVPRVMVEVTCKDRGPGIADMRLARKDGFSQGRFLGPEAPRLGGLGAGLGAIERLVDELTIDSVLDEGTLVIARKWVP